MDPSYSSLMAAMLMGNAGLGGDPAQGDGAGGGGGSPLYAGQNGAMGAPQQFGAQMQSATNPMGMMKPWQPPLPPGYGGMYAANPQGGPGAGGGGGMPWG